MLDQITPVLLTHNEAPNIVRTMSCLSWAKHIVVVDSGSSDSTLEILEKFGNVRVFSRRFDCHAEQWRYAVMDTQIASPWILRLDADYQVTPELVRELDELVPEENLAAYRIAFDYSVFSRKLRSSLYPPNTILLRRGHFKIWDNGHTESWTVDGAVGTLGARVIHDDRKATEFWMTAQGRYMRRELEKISAHRSGLRDWLRLRPPLMPIVVFFYCLFWKGLILDGRAGLFYTLQRTVAEAVLSLMVLEGALRGKVTSKRADDGQH